jgi:hypothetical protein
VGDGELGRVADVGGDVVAGGEGLGDDLAADAAVAPVAPKTVRFIVRPLGRCKPSLGWQRVRR